MMIVSIAVHVIIVTLCVNVYDGMALAFGSQVALPREPWSGGPKSCRASCAISRPLKAMLKEIQHIFLQYVNDLRSLFRL